MVGLCLDIIRRILISMGVLWVVLVKAEYGFRFKSDYNLFIQVQEQVIHASESYIVCNQKYDIDRETDSSICCSFDVHYDDLENSADIAL